MSTPPAHSQITEASFENYAGGKTTQWTLGLVDAEILAYLDENTDGSFTVILFTPYSGSRRTYIYKTSARATARVQQHLTQF